MNSLKKLLILLFALALILPIMGLVGCDAGGQTTPVTSEDQRVLPNASALAAYNLGVVQLSISKYDEAIAKFTEAIELDPKYALAYNGRGLAYYKKGQNDLAIADYNKVLKFSTDTDLTLAAKKMLEKLGQTSTSTTTTPPTTPAIGLKPDVIPLTIDTRFVSQLRAYIVVPRDGNVRYGVSSVTLMAYGGSPLVRYTWSNHLMGRIPPLGTIVDANGVFRGTGGAIAEGTYTFDVDVSDGLHTVTGAYTVIVEKQVEGVGAFAPSGQSGVGGIAVPPPPLYSYTPLQQPRMSTIPLVDGRAGEPYAASLLIIGGNPPYNWSANPADQFALATSGLLIDPISGIVKGTINPSMLGQTIKFRVIVQDHAEGTYPGTSTGQGGEGPVYTINVK